MEASAHWDCAGDTGTMGQMLEDAADDASLEALECKICFCLYTLRGRRPKVLNCCHRLCSKCLTKIVDLADGPANVVVCPFCRNSTSLAQESVESIPDDTNIMTVLKYNKRSLAESSVSAEVLLSPRHLGSLLNSSLSSSHGSRFTDISIMETAQDPHDPYDTTHIPASSDQEYLTSVSRLWLKLNCGGLICQNLARMLMLLLGLLYFTSLPLGVYLLVLRITTLGLLLVSLVPSTIAMFMIYGLCQCICQKICDCISD
ncbi:E3 ubiquitin-protein ligase RNF182-like [Arapaima gigas]